MPSLIGDLAGLDLSMPETNPPDLAVSVDLAGVDLAMPPPDLTPPPDLMPMCASSTTCTVPTAPYCDPALGICRACTSNSECSAAAPVCNPNGSCRLCNASSECASGVCDLRGPISTSSVGQCVDASDIVYVSNVTLGGPCVDGNGTSGSPYCQVNTALANLGSKHFVKVAGSATDYEPISYTGTSNLTVFISGPGRDVATPAHVVGAAGLNAVNLTPGTNAAVNVGIDGLTFSAVDHTVVYCEANKGTNGSTATLSVRNSLIENGANGVRALSCTLTLVQNIIRNASLPANNGDGVSVEVGSNWTVTNNIISGNATFGMFVDAASGTGTFRFNTVANNGVKNAAGGIYCGKNTTLESSIITANTKTAGAGGTQFFAVSGAACTLSNVVTGADGIGNTGKLSGDAAFVSATDFRLSLNGGDLTKNVACCIDKIGVSSTNPSLDFERDGRPRGLSWDVGADEVQ